ncbi:MAG: hemerythrin domain-containing protein [Parvularculaceae bacterium]
MTIAHHDEDQQRSEPDADIDVGSRTAIGPPALNLLDAPLDFLLAEHARQRQAATILSQIADGAVSRQTVSSLVEFIENDLAQHVFDNEVAFFPIVRTNCSPDDNIEALLSLLADEHREDEQVSDEIVVILRGLLQGLNMSDGDRKTLRDFAVHLRHQIALEDGVLLPIARARLNADSLRVISQSMMERRSRRRR